MSVDDLDEFDGKSVQVKVGSQDYLKYYSEACDELEKRCKAANIDFDKIKDFDGDTYLTIAMPCGRSKRLVNLFDLDDIEKFRKINFEKYTFLGDYIAICLYDSRTIEASITILGSGFAAISYNRINHLLSKIKTEQSKLDNLPLLLYQTSGNQGIRISIEPVSEDLLVLSGRRLNQSRPSACLKIKEGNITRHDQALDLLEKISNSIFFQIELALNMPLGILRERRPRRRILKFEKEYELEFPKREYDHAPIALYWYARSAVGMPLMQFLAYYQCIEYYFPTYSEAEAKKRIRKILKDPIFRSDRDADIGRLLGTMRPLGSYGFGDERSQLRATIQECIDQHELRSFFAINKEREEHYLSKSKGLKCHKIPLANLNADLRNDVAERIYDIRCKIVHTKTGERGGDIELLLPFSKESELLYHDIDLIQYIAQQILISASSGLHI